MFTKHVYYLSCEDAPFHRNTSLFVRVVASAFDSQKQCIFAFFVKFRSTPMVCLVHAGSPG